MEKCELCCLSLVLFILSGELSLRIWCYRKQLPMSLVFKRQIANDVRNLAVWSAKGTLFDGCSKNAHVSEQKWCCPFGFGWAGTMLALHFNLCTRWISA